MEFAEIDKSTGFITIYIETNKAVGVSHHNVRFPRNRDLPLCVIYDETK